MTTTYKNLQITPNMIRIAHSERIAIRKIELEEERQRAEQAKKDLLGKVDAVYENQAELLTQSILQQLYATIVKESGSNYRFENGSVKVVLSVEEVDAVIGSINTKGQRTYLEEKVSDHWQMEKYLRHGGSVPWISYESDYKSASYNVAKHVLFEKVKASLERKGFPAKVPALYMPKPRKMNMVIDNEITVTIK